MIPQVAGQAEAANDPSVLGIKAALEGLDKLKEQRAKLMDDAMQKVANLNAIDDLMAVNQAKKQKGDVFAAQQQALNDVFVPMQELEKQRGELSTQIQNGMVQFGQLVSKLSADQSKQQYFSQLDQAINAYSEVANMMHQGSQFYQRLGEILNKLLQNVNDFKVSREFEKNDLISKLGGGNFQPPPSQGMPQMYGQPGVYPPGQPGMPGQPGQPGQPGMPGQPGQMPAYGFQPMQPGQQPQYGQFPPQVPGQMPQYNYQYYQQPPK